MFKKVQLKFFGIITSILIAIFIGVLSSINIIMDALMERQTKVVLQQVATGVEYNDKTSTFTFTDPNKGKEEKPKKKDPPPPVTKPPEEVTEGSTAPPETKPEKETKKTTVTTEAEQEEVTDPPRTDAPTESPKPAKTTEAAKPAKTTEPPKAPAKTTEAPTHPKETKPPKPEKTEPPREPAHTEPPAPTDPPQNNDPWGGGEWQFPTDPNFDPWNPWTNPWMNPWYNPWGGDWGNFDWGNGDQNNNNNNNNNNGGEHDGDQHRDQRSSGDEGGYRPMADTDLVPVLEGYTIEIKGRSVYDNKPPEPPIMDGHDKFSEPVPKSLGSIDFFVIMADESGKYEAAMNNDELTADIAQGYIDAIFNSKESSGMTGNLSYCAEKKSNGTLMVLSDRTSEIAMMNKLRRTTVIVGIISIIFLSAAGYFLSGLIVRPIKDTFEKQKQFISDASHELKTPLTVISTNADVLAGEIGCDNKWLNYIQDQADRMNVLVNDLLSLTRLENSSREFITTEFDLSRAVTNSALPFECQAFENRKNFVLNIEEGITITGSEQHIKQMAGIFIDNALKYSKDGGTVRVSLTKEDGKAVLAVYNTGSGVREEEVDKLFERFYRSDESRNRSTGGYGLGLAIAKSIIDKHKFKVQVENLEGRSICFVVTM